MVFNNVPSPVYHIPCTWLFRTVLFDLFRRFAQRPEAGVGGCLLRRCPATTRFRFLRVVVVPSIIDSNYKNLRDWIHDERHRWFVVEEQRIRIGGDVETTSDCRVMSLGWRTTTNNRGIYRVSYEPIQFPKRARIPLSVLWHPSSHRWETPTPPRPFCAHSTSSSARLVYPLEFVSRVSHYIRLRFYVQ